MNRGLEEPKRVRINVALTHSGDPNLVYIGRECGRGGYNLKRSIWANPNSLNKYHDDRQACLDDYYAYFMDPDSKKLQLLLSSLAGKTMMCFCERHELCHGDVISYIGEQMGLWVRE